MAHIAHDGLTDMLYIFFPIWQALFGLSYTEVGLFKTLFSGSLAALQIPAGMLGDRVGFVRTLAAGTFITCFALISSGYANSATNLATLLIIAGIGASAQHPLASAAISRAYSGKNSRAALSTYNFSGDLGKLAFPALGAVLIAHYQWRLAIMSLAGIALLLGAAVFVLLRGQAVLGAKCIEGGRSGSTGGRLAATSPFAALTTIGVIDSATRMGFLTFLPFLLQGKGADIPTLGLALGLIFAGGAAGKLVCGLLASWMGVLRTVIVTEVFTSLAILGIVVFPLWAALSLAPILGLVLNGTSSVLYGSVPELVGEAQRNRAFAIFYTGTIGSGALAPIFFGIIGDALGIPNAISLVALMVLCTIPLTLPLRTKLGS